MIEKFDAIVIGAGQSGPFLAAKLAEAGEKVALIEREHLGGTCVNDGCTPTKTLVASARAAWTARSAAAFGVAIAEPVSVDMRAVKARKDAVVGASIQSLTGWLGGLESLEVIRGVGRFVGAREVAVGGRHLSAGRIFINVGGTASIPAWPGLQDVPYLTNTSIMDVDELPEHVVIAGGSYIGLEFAQMYARFGPGKATGRRSQRRNVGLEGGSALELDAGTSRNERPVEAVKAAEISAPLAVAAIVIVALGLRPSLVLVGPVLPCIIQDFGLSHARASRLTSIPGLLMGLFALPAGAGQGRRA